VVGFPIIIYLYMYMISTLLQSGFKGSMVLFFSVLSYKIYKMRISTESSCFNGCLKLHTYNNGGSADVENVAVTGI
jgi:hypothetical protein